MLEQKHLGVVPGSEDEYVAQINDEAVLRIPNEVIQLMRQGREWYKIQYISPAKRMQQAEELQGIYSTMEIANAAAAIDPTVLDWINKDTLLRRATELGGGPAELINDSTTVEQIQIARAQQQQALAQEEAARNQSEIARNYAQAITMGQGQGG